MFLLLLHTHTHARACKPLTPRAAIMTMIDEAKQPRVFLFTERASKWAIVRARLRDGTLRKLRRQHGGVNPAERAWRRRVAQNMRRGAQKGDMQEFNRW
jgi:hypothetical protein